MAELTNLETFVAAVKSGSFEFLRPFRQAICEAGIDARIL